jgi:single-strand DNA-binding protein
MHGVNKVTLIGNVGKDPETRYLESGVPVSTFSLATSESFKNKNGERVTSTEWHNIVLWRGLAELAEKYVHKGDPLFIEGKIRTRTWEDKEGRRRYTTEIIANNMIMLSPRDKGEGGDFSEIDIDDEELGLTDHRNDDLPF